MPAAAAFAVDAADTPDIFSLSLATIITPFFTATLLLFTPLLPPLLPYVVFFAITRR